MKVSSVAKRFWSTSAILFGLALILWYRDFICPCSGGQFGCLNCISQGLAWYFIGIPLVILGIILTILGFNKKGGKLKKPKE